MIAMENTVEVKIPDEEWELYLQEVYGNIVYGKPDKSVIEKYLTWKENQGK